MARRRKKRGGRRKSKIPLAATAGVAAALLPIAQTAMSGNLTAAASQLSSGFTGYDPATGAFNAAALQRGLMPIILGVAVSMLAAKAGLNRYLRIPMVKI